MANSFEVLAIGKVHRTKYPGYSGVFYFMDSDYIISFISMKVQILLFGIARDIVGKPQLEFEHSGPIDVKSFKQALQDKYPKMNYLSYFKVAINQEFATDQQMLNEGDEVALIPPVSGG